MKESFLTRSCHLKYRKIELHSMDHFFLKVKTIVPLCYRTFQVDSSFDARVLSQSECRLSYLECAFRRRLMKWSPFRNMKQWFWKSTKNRSLYSWKATPDVEGTQPNRMLCKLLMIWQKHRGSPGVTVYASGDRLHQNEEDFMLKVFLVHVGNNLRRLSG
jgi:hypothetical protein